MGAECESLICAACTTVVEEFGIYVCYYYTLCVVLFVPSPYVWAGQALRRESENPRMVYISDVAHGFCGNKEVRSKYGELVELICIQLFNDVSVSMIHLDEWIILFVSVGVDGSRTCSDE